MTSRILPCLHPVLKGMMEHVQPTLKKGCEYYYTKEFTRDGMSYFIHPDKLKLAGTFTGYIQRYEMKFEAIDFIDLSSVNIIHINDTETTTYAVFIDKNGTELEICHDIYDPTRFINK